MYPRGLAAAAHRISRTDLLAYAVAVGVCAFHLATPLMENFTGDIARYMGLADAIREGRGYEFNFRPHTRFPPGIAMILAVTRGVIGKSYASDAATMAIFAGLSLIVGYTLLKTLGHPQLGLIAVLAVAASGDFYARGTQHVSSDLPFFVLCLTALTMAERVVSGAQGRLAFPRALVLALLVVATLMVRGSGVALLGALGLWTLLQVVGVRRSRHWTLWLLPAVVAGAVWQGAWWWWQALNRVDYWPGEFMNSYWTQFRLRNPHEPQLGAASLTDFGTRAGHNLVSQASHVSELVTGLPWIEPRWYSPFVVLPVLFVSVGLIRAMRGQTRIVALFLPLYIGLHLLWPFDEGARYMLPVLPLVLLYGWLGVRHLHDLTIRHLKGSTGWVCVAAACLFLGSVASLFQREAVGRQTVMSIVAWLGLFLATAVINRTQILTPGRAVAISAAVAKGCVVLFALAVLAGFSRQVSLASRNLRGDPSLRFHRASIEAARWLAPRLEAGESAMAGQEAIVHYLTGYRVIPLPVTSDAIVLKSVIDRFNVRYIVIYRTEDDPYFLPTERTRLAALTRAYPDMLVVVQETDDFAIYRITDVSG